MANNGTWKKKSKKEHYKRIRYNQSTITQQLIDLDLKVEAMNSVLTRRDIVGFMEVVTQKLEGIEKKPHQSTHATKTIEELLMRLEKAVPQFDSNAAEVATNPPPTPPEIEAENLIILPPPLEYADEMVKSLQAHVLILEEEVEGKNKQIEELRVEVTATRKETHQQLALLQSANSSLKAQSAAKDTKISDYMSMEDEWGLLMSKKSNALQVAEMEYIELKKQIDSSSSSVNTTLLKSVQQENIELKQENHKLKSQLAATPLQQHGKNIFSTVDSNVTTKTAHVEPEPDVWFLHDSIGKRITPKILSKHQLTTKKELTYTQEEAIKALSRITSAPKAPKAVVLLTGTNNLKNTDADDILKTYDKIISSSASKMPDTKLIICNIVPREDNHEMQRHVEYVNAVLNRKFAARKNLSLVKTFDITGKRLKAKDGIHLTELGTSKLASRIKDAVVTALT